MQVNIVDLNNDSAGSIELEDTIFGVEVREHLFWEVVKWQRAKRRAGTNKVKTRSEVSGGGKKPWRQKGTGRARQGSIRSPQWVGGGVVHGPSPRDYGYRIPKKKRKAALRCALSLKVEQSNMFIVDAFEMGEAKTSKLAKAIKSFDAKKALFVDVTEHPVDKETGKPLHKPIHNEALRNSTRNLKNAKYIAVEGLNVEDLLGHQALVISRKAVEYIQETLKP